MRQPTTSRAVSHGPRRVLAAALALALIIAACATATDQLPTWPPAPSLTRDAVVELLASAGIAVTGGIEGYEPTVPVAEPRAPLTLTLWQAERLAGELSSAGGVLGRDLDEVGALAGLPDDAPPLSYLVAGWLTGLDTAAATKALELVGERDWERASDVVFPRLVLLLFVADVARDARAASGPGPPAAIVVLDRPVAMLNDAAMVGAVPVAALTAPSVCPNLAGWIDGILDALFQALKFDDAEGLVGIFTTIWNVAVDIAQSVVSNILKVLTAPVIAAIKLSLAVVGTISFMASFLVGWEIDIDLEPGSADHWAHHGEPNQTGAFVAKVKGAVEGWPDYIVGCARDAGIPLPDIAPLGKDFAWDVFSSGETHATGSLDGLIGDPVAARLAYVTGREGEVTSDFIGVEQIHVYLEIERFSEDDIDTLLEELVFTGTAGAILLELLSPIITEAKETMTSLMLESGGGGTYIGYHLQPEGTPTRPPDPPPTPTPDDPDPPDVPGLPDNPAPSEKCSVGPCGGSNGDPHIITLSGERYDFMAAGEYVLVRSPDGRVEIQARQERYPSEYAVTINTAIAARVGTHRVVFDLDPETGDVRVNVDGTAVVGGAPVDLGSDGSLVHVEGGYGLDLADGTTLLAMGQGELGINAVVAPSEGLLASAVGLLGLVAPGGMGIPPLPDGTVLPVPADDHAAFEALYGPFAEAWRVTDESSLFEYPEGLSTDDYLVPGFPAEDDLFSPSEIAAEILAAAEAACAGVTDPAFFAQCAYDVAVTDETGFAETYEVTERWALEEPLPGPALPEGVVQVVSDIDRLHGADLGPDGTLYASIESTDGQARLIAVDTLIGTTRAAVDAHDGGMVAVATETVWVGELVERDDCSISRVDPLTLAVQVTLDIPCGISGGQFVATADALWYHDDTVEGGGAVLQRVDPQTGAIVATIPLPFVNGFLRASQSTVFFSDSRPGQFRLTPGTTSFERIGATQAFDSFPADDGLWAGTADGAAFFTVGDTPTRTINFDGQLAAAHGSAVYAQLQDPVDGSATLWRFGLDGSAPTQVARGANLVADLDYAADDEQEPLLVGDSVLVKLWVAPALDDAERQALLLQRADLP